MIPSSQKIDGESGASSAIRVWSRVVGLHDQSAGLSPRSLESFVILADPDGGLGGLAVTLASNVIARSWSG